MRLWFEVNQHKECSIRTFNEKGSEVEIIICQVISITARLIVLFNIFVFIFFIISIQLKLQITNLLSFFFVKFTFHILSYYFRFRS